MFVPPNSFSFALFCSLLQGLLFLVSYSLFYQLALMFRFAILFSFCSTSSLQIAFLLGFALRLSFILGGMLEKVAL